METSDYRGRNPPAISEDSLSIVSPLFNQPQNENRNCRRTFEGVELLDEGQIRSLSVCRFWYPWRCWNQSPEDTEGPHYIYFLSFPLERHTSGASPSAMLTLMAVCSPKGMLHVL